MQTIKENQINYFVFPQDTVSSAGLPDGSKSYFLYAYETMANNSGSGDGSTATVVQQGDRWRIASTYVESTNTEQNGRLFLRAGTTYEVQLRYGVVDSITWSEVKTLWTDTDYVWSADISDFNLDTSNLVSLDRVFCSGSVSPNQKLYITSNEDAEMTIYQG